MITYIFYSYLFFYENQCVLFCVGHPRRLTSYMNRELPYAALPPFIYSKLRSPLSLPSHVSRTFVIYKSHLHTELSLSYSPDLPILGILLAYNYFILSIPYSWQRECSVCCPLARWSGRQSASESWSLWHFVVVLFSSTGLLPVLGSFRAHLVHN